MASYPANSVAESDCAGSGSASGGTGNSCSPAMRNDSRLVTSSVSRGAVREEDREVRRGGHHLLDVVEQQEQSAIAQIGLEEISGGLVAHLEETQGLSNRRDDERPGSLIAASGTKQTPFAYVVGKIGGDLEREAGLADAAGAGQGQQTDRHLVAGDHARPLASRSRPMSGVRGIGSRLVCSPGATVTTMQTLRIPEDLRGYCRQCRIRPPFGASSAWSGRGVRQWPPRPRVPPSWRSWQSWRSSWPSARRPPPFPLSLPQQVPT